MAEILESDETRKDTRNKVNSEVVIPIDREWNSDGGNDAKGVYINTIQP